MGRIQKLSTELINRIAAGECVERPASVVKELVENALDAGAARIDVTVLDGGRELIEVRDDGGGMDADDLRMCVEPHATSKIASDDDLFSIHTLGFRGEALPSIASVSRLTVTSRTRDSEVGCTLRVEGGAIGNVTPCSAPQGTTVQVRDLFYNVPARQKFLRTPQTEMGHISEQLARIALAHTGVAFSLRHGTRLAFALEAVRDPRERIAALFGEEVARVLLPVGRKGVDVSIDGLVAPPSEGRGSGKWEYTFVNGRFVRDRFVSHAIREAYRSLIDPARFPVTFLFITINPSLVDVNVHPTKIEVRWRDSNYIHGQVLATLRDKFLSTNLDASLRTREGDEAYRERVRGAMAEYFLRSRPQPQAPPLPGLAPPAPAVTRGISPLGSAATPQVRSPAVISAPAASHDDAARSLDELASHYARSLGREPDAVAAEPSRNALLAQPAADPAGGARSAAAGCLSPGGAPAAELPMPSVAGVHPAYAERAAAASAAASGDSPGTHRAARPVRPAVQVHDAYIVVETDDGLMIIDQHALHERILYEELRARLTQAALESQRLLIPEVIRVPPDRIEVLESRADLLARLGIDLAAGGPHSVTLSGFPTLLERMDREAFVRDLLDRLSEHGAEPATDTLLHELLDMMACKAAVKAGDPLTPEEVEALLERRELAERSSSCPHGRPTTLHLSLRELEKQFKRR